MKITSYILCLLVLCSCKSKNRSESKDRVSKTTIENSSKKESPKATFVPYQINQDYTVVDTGEYANDGPMSGGSYAIIKNKGVVLDTIDLYYGMMALGHQTYFYRKLSHETDPSEMDSKNILILEEGNFFLVTNNDKIAFNKLTSNFDDYFSSPDVINQKIYFWKLEKVDTVGKLKVSATEFDPLTKKTKSYFLLNDILETDDSNYFPSPYLEKGNIIFTMEGKKKWKFSTEFNPN